MHALFCNFLVTAVQKLLKCVKKSDRVAVKCTLLRFMNHGKNVSFDIFEVRCTHRSDDVINCTTVACTISSRLKWYKNYKNWLRWAKVIMSRFYGSLCICVSRCVLCVFVSYYIVHSCCVIVGTVGWTLCDWSLIIRTYLSSVLWHSWLGYLSHKTRPGYDL